MNSAISKYFAIGLSLISTFTFGLSYKMGSGRWVTAQTVERPETLASTLTVGTYNVENLFQKAVQPPQRIWMSLSDVLDAVTPLKPVGKIKALANVILEIGYDILVVEDVENIATLELLDDYYLNNLYQPLLIEGNDMRGIDVGFLIKKDLPYSIENRTNKTETWQDPTHAGEIDLLFSRDVPELHVFTDREALPIFVLLGTHYKSKIGRKNDPNSNILRKAQVERTADIFDRLDRGFDRQVPLFISGDFNGEVAHENEFAAFKDKYQLFDAFDSNVPPLKKTDRFTHLYFPKGKPFERSQLDGFMFDSKSKEAIRRAYPFRYKDSSGVALPIPTTFAEKDRNPSDHYPVVVELDVRTLRLR